MAVSKDVYQSSRDYLKDVLTFLKTYEWVYNYPNTHITKNRIIEKFPKDWMVFFKNLTNEELNNLPLGLLNVNAPNSIKQFLLEIENLKPKINTTIEPCDQKFKNNCKIGIKKVHEILSFAPLIHKIYEKENCDSILDIGAGLGYLPQLLYDKYKYPILAIEGCSEKIESAKKNLKNSSIEYFEHFVTENSESALRNLFNGINNNQSVCITGLHACADLSITILKLFIKLEFAKSLIIMPCCYHRLELENEFDNKENFKYFPISNLMKELFKEFEANSFLKRPFLRLACQETVNSFSTMTEKEHEERGKKLLYRGILQEVAMSENYQIKRLKRKSGNKLLQSTDNYEKDFENYLSNLEHSYTLIHGNETIRINSNLFLDKMREKWFECKNDYDLIEVLIGLQAAIQSICEYLVLLDRVEFLKENGLDCFIEKVTNEIISPRCYALVATKLS